MRWVSAFKTRWAETQLLSGITIPTLKQNGDGLLDVYANGQHVFRFQNGALQSHRAVNVSGRVTPTDYGNFDERYQTRTGGVQNFQYTSEVFHNPGHYDDGHYRSFGVCRPVGGDVAPSSALKLYSRPIQKLYKWRMAIRIRLIKEK